MVNHKLFSIIIFFVLMCSGIFLYLDYHENVHKTIFNNYGVESEINYFNWNMSNIWHLTATTTAENATNCTELCIQDQNEADTIGYHTIALIFNLWLMLAFAMIYWRTD